MDKEILKRFDEEFPPFMDGQCGDHTASPRSHIKSFVQSEIEKIETAVKYNVDEETWTRIKNALIALRK
jgi:hypothetical protein